MKNENYFKNREVTMQNGDEIECGCCGEIVTIDIFDIADGEAFCMQCGERMPIWEEDGDEEE